LTLEILSRISDLFERLGSYSALAVAFELGVIWLLVWVVVRFVEGTRAAGALKGALVLVVVTTVAVQIIGGRDAFPRLVYLYERALAVVAIGLVVVFQPELRRALVRLGETSLLRGDPTGIAAVVEPIAEACAYLSRSRFGAIIVIERQVGLRGLVEGGTVLDAELSSRLLQTLFFPGTALHDLAVVLKGRVVHAAGVQLPMAEPEEMPDRSLGARHRAAVGLAKECDALVVVVSEETGAVRIAERGRLSGPLSIDELRTELGGRLGATISQEAKTAAESAEESEDGAERSKA
jgi:diadenylate cyclase